MSQRRALMLIGCLSLLGAISFGAPAAALPPGNPPFSVGEIVISEFFDELYRIDPGSGLKTPMAPGDFEPVSHLAIDPLGRMVAIDSTDRLVRFNPVTLSVAPLTTTLFPAARGLALELGGTVLVARGPGIFRIDPVSGVTTTLVDNATINGGFFSPRGIAVGPTGRIFVTEFFEDVWEINPISGAVVNVSPSMDLTIPSFVQVRSDGDLIVREFSTDKLLRINPNTHAMSVFATDVPATINGMAIERDNSIVISTSNHGVWRYDAATGAPTLLTPFETFFAPQGIAVSTVPEPAGHQIVLTLAALCVAWRQRHDNRPRLRRARSCGSRANCEISGRFISPG